MNLTTSTESVIVTTTTLAPSTTIDAVTTNASLAINATDTNPVLQGPPEGFVPLLIVTLVLFLGLCFIVICLLVPKSCCKCCSLKWIWANRIVRNSKSMGQAFLRGAEGDYEEESDDVEINKPAASGRRGSSSAWTDLRDD